MDSGNWPPDTQSPFPRRKAEKDLVASKGYTSLWFSLFNLTIHSVAVWQAQVTSSPSVQRATVSAFQHVLLILDQVSKVLCRPGNEPCLCGSERTQREARNELEVGSTT